MGEWRTEPLIECLAALIDYRGKSPPKSNTGIPVLSAKVVKSTGLLWPIKQMIAPDYYPKWMVRGLPQPGDVVMTTEAPMGEVIQIDEETAQFALGQRVVCMRGKSEKLDNTFLRYLLISPVQQEILASYATGTTVLGISQKALRSMPISFPSHAEQERIGQMLAALDDKVEVNRRINETLEAMARTIFKDWFVDFGPTRAKTESRAPYLAPELWDLFPDALDEEDKPIGWRNDSLGALFNVSIGRTPPRKERQHFVPGGKGKTWLSIKSMGNIQTFAVASEEDLTPQAVKQFRISLIPVGTVLVSFKLTVGRVAIAAKEMHSNEAIAHLVANDKTPVANVFTYCFMKNFDYDTLSSTSSIATAVNSKSIKAIEIIVPDAPIHSAFLEIVQPLFDRILCNLRESDTLAQTRDRLLPKLMSGEIRLTEAEKAVEAVA